MHLDLHAVALWGYLFGLSTVTGLLEIQIEGKHGWASALPTWRVRPRWLLAITNGKPITGYHLYLNLLLLMLFHLPAVVAPTWSLGAEFRLLSLWAAYLALWDLNWFVHHRHYGIARFRQGNIWWYRRWVGCGRIPVDYLTSVVGSGLAWVLAGLFPEDPAVAWMGWDGHMATWAVGIVGAWGLTLLVGLLREWRWARTGGKLPLPTPEPAADGSVERST